MCATMMPIVIPVLGFRCNTPAFAPLFWQPGLCYHKPVVDARVTTLHVEQLPSHASMRVSKALRTASESDMALPELPLEVWGIIARATLAAEDYNLPAWARLSLVSRAWRDCLAGAQTIPSCFACWMRLIITCSFLCCSAA